MKITTLNLQGFTDWKARKPLIMDYLTKENPDIILFQEVVFLPEVSAWNQAQILNRELNYPYEHSSVTRLQVGLEYETYREGLAFVSRFPVTTTDTIVLKKAPEDPLNRIIQLIDVVINNQTIKLANVHFSVTDTTDFATAHLQETLAILAEREEERIIIGDFNLTSLDTTTALWRDHYTASTTFPYVSFPGMNKSIDYILVPKSYNLDSVIESGDGLSDHRALTAGISRLELVEAVRQSEATLVHI